MDQKTKELGVQENQKSPTDLESKEHGAQVDLRSLTDLESKERGVQEDRKSPIVQESKEQGEPDFVGDGLADVDFATMDPDFSKEVCQLVLDKHQSQGTQTLEKRLPSPQMGEVSCEEQLERTKRAIADSKRGIKSMKSVSEYLDDNSLKETLSSELKDRFIALNLKHSAVYPDDFKIYVDCQQFQPSEVKLSIEKDFFVVRASHQLKFDDHGIIKREFTRRWFIPEDVKRDKFKCLFNRYNILIIQAPRVPDSITVPVQIEMSKE